MTAPFSSSQPFPASDTDTASPNGHTPVQAGATSTEATGQPTGRPGGRGRAACWAVGTAGGGSAGSTTLAVALATHTGAVLVEADPDGGAVGLRYGCWLHDSAPSLASLLASLRPGASAAVLGDHVQRLPSGARAVLLAPVAEQAVGPVEHLDAHLEPLRALLADERLVLDVGRLRPGGPALRLARQCDALVVVTWPTVEGLACLLARLPLLAGQVRHLAVAVRGEGPYRVGEISDEIRARAGRPFPVVVVPEDPRGASRLGARPGRAGGRSGGRSRAITGLDRCPLLAATAALARTLAPSSTHQSSTHDGTTHQPTEPASGAVPSGSTP